MDMHRLRHSRAVEEAGYDDVARVLRIHFRGGGTYDYLDVPARIFDGLLSSEHPWTQWGQHIKSNYDFRPLS